MVLSILGAEVGGGAYIYSNKDKLTQDVENLALKFLKQDYFDSNTSASDVGWNFAMKEVGSTVL